MRCRPPDEDGPPAATCIEARGVSRWFGDNHVLDEVDLEVGLHGRLGIVGASGGGKSTLLSLICGLDEPDSGEVTVQDHASAAGRLECCALMPQRDLLLPWRLAIDNAGLALENKGLSRREARERVAPMFERFGLAGADHLRPGRAVGRDAPAGRVPADAARREGGSAARRAVRRA